MARAPKKAPKLEVVGGTAGPGHNSALTDEQMQALHLNNHVPAYERALKAKKDADAAFKNVCKTIKAEGGSIDDVKRTIELRTPEGEAKLKVQIEQMLRVARWAGLPLGTQSDLFGPDRRPVEERAFEDGKRAGLAGKDCKTEHAPGTEAYDKWIEGWHAGQAVLAAGFGKKADDVPEVLRVEGKETPGDDDFNDAANGGDTPWPDDEAVAKQASGEL